MSDSPNIKRKLAAIMFTDIAGFTALTAHDEQKALQLLDKQRKLLRPIVEEFSGIINKEIGDGLLITFPIVSEAVNCAIKIQDTTKSIDDLNLRIGIHEGEITERDEDVLGDDVNIASRIEPFSAIGGIAISGKVQQNILSLPEYETKLIGIPKLKGVEQEVKVYCITSHQLPYSKKKYKQDDTKLHKKEYLHIFISTMFGIILFNYFIPLIGNIEIFQSKASMIEQTSSRPIPTQHAEETINTFTNIESLISDSTLEANLNAFNLIDELIISDTTQGDYSSIKGRILFQRYKMTSNVNLLNTAIINLEKSIDSENTNNLNKVLSCIDLSDIYLDKDNIPDAYRVIKKSFILNKNYPGLRKRLKKINRKRLQFGG